MEPKGSFMSEDQVTKILVGIGTLKDGQVRVEKRIERIESNVEDIRNAQVENGKTIAVLRQTQGTHAKSLSGLYTTVDSIQEDTGMMRIAEAAQQARLAATWKTVAVAAGLLTTGAGLALGLAKLLG